jgi:predicted nucleic acid-binding protein
MADKLILVDTSIWIDYLRNGNSKEAQELDHILSLGIIATCDPIKTEIISGAPNKSDFQKLRIFLNSIIFLDAPENIWRSIEDYRFLLARKGTQASLIDLWIAVVAEENNALIWTLDKDFIAMNKVVHFEIFYPNS